MIKELVYNFCTGFFFLLGAVLIIGTISFIIYILPAFFLTLCFIGMCIVFGDLINC